MLLGNIHSIESFGTVDGPGLRFVIFFQGCPMRCAYCHNPDTWGYDSPLKMTTDELLEQFNKNKAFYRDGGITVTGGEPLLQIDFIIELFKKARAENIHTCIDTSGITFSKQTKDKFDELIKYTSLVMLDIKHIDDIEHQHLCLQSNKNILAFARYLSDNQVETWIRHVVVPTITDNKDYLFKLGQFIGSLSSVTALDVLPYHTMGVQKYHQLNIPYRLEGIKELSKDEAKIAKQVILDGIKDYKKNH